MFKKRTFLNMEFLDNGEVLLTSNVNKNTDPTQISGFLNQLMLRENIEEFLQSIMESANKNKVPNLGEAICEDIISVQKGFEIVPVSRSARNPLIKPVDVMKNFMNGSDHE